MFINLIFFAFNKVSSENREMKGKPGIFFVFCCFFLSLVKLPSCGQAYKCGMSVYPSSIWFIRNSIENDYACVCACVSSEHFPLYLVVILISIVGYFVWE